MKINVHDHGNSLETVLEIAESVKDRTGCTIYFQGSEVPYGDPNAVYQLPRNAHLEGDGFHSKIASKLIFGSYISGETYHKLNFLNGGIVDAARNMVMQSCFLGSTLEFRGPTYHNLVQVCRWMDLGDKPAITSVNNTQNHNKIWGCRIYHKKKAIDLSGEGSGPFTNGWSFRGTSIEGVRDPDGKKLVLEPAIILGGRGHVVEECWFEGSAGNSYGPMGTIALLPGSRDCKIGCNTWSYLCRVEDEGRHNKVSGYWESKTWNNERTKKTYRYD